MLPRVPLAQKEIKEHIKFISFKRSRAFPRRAYIPRRAYMAGSGADHKAPAPKDPPQLEDTSRRFDWRVSCPFCEFAINCGFLIAGRRRSHLKKSHGDQLLKNHCCCTM